MRNTANATNASANAYYRVLDFLESRLEGDEQWSPKVIAKELDIPEGTVRWCLKKAKENGRVFYIPKGRVHLYASTRRFSDDFNRLFKAYGTKQRYEIHGLTLKLTAKSMGKRSFANTIPLGGMVRSKIPYFGGETSFQLSKTTFMVYGGFTDRPLDYDRFVLWLSAVDGYCHAKGWPSIEGNMECWKVVQYGLNQDRKRFRNDSPTRCVSLQGFKNWFARVYEKEELGVMREEIHSREEKTLEEFVTLASGGMTSVQILNYLGLVTTSLNNQTKVSVDIIKELGKLKDQMVALTDELKKLKRS